MVFFRRLFCFHFIVSILKYFVFLIAWYISENVKRYCCYIIVLPMLIFDELCTFKVPDSLLYAFI